MPVEFLLPISAGYIAVKSVQFGTEWFEASTQLQTKRYQTLTTLHSFRQHAPNSFTFLLNLGFFSFPIGNGDKDDPPKEQPLFAKFSGEDANLEGKTSRTDWIPVGFEDSKEFPQKVSYINTADSFQAFCSYHNTSQSSICAILPLIQRTYTIPKQLPLYMHKDWKYIGPNKNSIARKVALWNTFRTPFHIAAFAASAGIVAYKLYTFPRLPKELNLNK